MLYDISNIFIALHFSVLHGKKIKYSTFTRKNSSFVLDPVGWLSSLTLCCILLYCWLTLLCPVSLQLIPNNIDINLYKTALTHTHTSKTRSA